MGPHGLACFIGPQLLILEHERLPRDYFVALATIKEISRQPCRQLSQPLRYPLRYRQQNNGFASFGLLPPSQHTNNSTICKNSGDFLFVRSVSNPFNAYE